MSLCKAAGQGDLRRVEDLIRRGFNVNEKLSENDETALRAASYIGHLDIVKVLIAGGADVNIKNDKGATALLAASYIGHLDIVKEFIVSGADLNIKNNTGGTALQAASSLGHLDIVKVLIASGADVNIKNYTGATALQAASSQDHLDIVKALIASGADVNIKNYKGGTAIQAASYIGHLDIVKALIASGADVNIKNDTGLTLLHVASVEGHLETLKCLIANGADISATDYEGHTALHAAALEGRAPVAEFLIKMGADVNPASDRLQTPLIIAAYKGFVDVASILLRNGADLSARNYTGRTPLHCAAALGRKEMVKYLVEEWDVDLFNEIELGYTAAKLASQSGHTTIVEYLVSKMQDERKHSAQRLLTANELDPGLLATAAQCGRMATLQMLITSLGSDPSYRQPTSGLNAEDIAHSMGHSDIVWFLNKSTEGRNRPSGSRPELVNCKSEYTTFSLKEMQSRKADSLINDTNLDAGLYDLHFQDEEGMTHLHVAVKKNEFRVMSRLLERGALATALTHDGVTPIDLARREGSLEAVDMIEKHLRKFIENKLKSSSEKSHYFTIMLSLILECISISTRYKDDDSKVEKEQQKVLKKVSWLLSLGVPLEPPGNYHTHALHLAIISNCKRILTLLLAAGAPLYATCNGMGPVEAAWLTPDVTTWIAVAVTRAVMHKLKAEVKELKLRNVIDWVLMFGIVHLVNQLDGEKPWQTKLSCLDKYLSLLLGAACEQGATLTAWWVWRAGGCCLFQRKKDGKTPLHMALDSKHYQTAAALVQYMEANSFLPDDEGRLPIDVFPERKKDDVLKGSLVSEYRILDGVLQRAIDSGQKREAKDMILLLLTLFSVGKNSQSKLFMDENRWMNLSISLISLLRNVDDVHDSQNWILKLNEELNGIISVVQYKTNKPNAKYRENVTESRNDMTTFLHELDSDYYTDEESDSLAILMNLLETWVKQSLASGRTLPSLSGRDSQNINGSYIKNILLKKGLEMCSGMKLPMFFHLLVSIAKVDVRIYIDPITKTEALHQAAMNGNMSATSFLLKNGASKTKQDRYGRTPSHYAYMHGHKTLGESLNAHPEITSENGLKPTDLWQGYTKYLHLYGVNVDVISKPELIECNDSDDLIQFHLKALNARWSKRGIKKAVMEAKVDYTNGESFAVQNAIKQLLGKLISEVGNLDSRFEGELVFVGSSADDVRLLTPDEYDCNVVFKNFSGYPDGGCQILLQDSLNTNKETDIIVSTVQENLKDLFEERTLLVKFSHLIKKCLPSLSMDDPRLSLTLPSVKLTQVGVGLSFAWNGTEFPLLLVDVDIVPTMKAPWPPELEKTRLLPDVEEVYLNTVGSNEWRFSSAQDEKRVMECLSDDERFVFLACKLAIGSLKTEGWMLKQVKDQFKFWDGQMMKIPYPKGFLLKNSFFFEKEVTDPTQWKEDKLLERMCSIFRRMCHEMEKGNRIIFVPGKIPAYFGRSTEEQCVGFGAPEILAFLQDWRRSSSMHDRSVRPKAFAHRK